MTIFDCRVNNFENADTICFLLPYGKSRSINVPISKDAREKLSKVDRSMGDKADWWIVGIKDQNVIYLYHIRSRISRAPYSKTCVETRGLFLKSLPLEKSGGREFFEVLHTEE